MALSGGRGQNRFSPLQGSGPARAGPPANRLKMLNRHRETPAASWGGGLEKGVRGRAGVGVTPRAGIWKQ